MVTDLRHFLDQPEDIPGPARRLAAQLGAIVRAASAGDVGLSWEASPYDLRGRGLTVAGAGGEVVLSQEVAAALRELRLRSTVGS